MKQKLSLLLTLNPTPEGTNKFNVNLTGWEEYSVLEIVDAVANGLGFITAMAVMRSSTIPGLLDNYSGDDFVEMFCSQIDNQAKATWPYYITNMTTKEIKET